MDKRRKPLTPAEQLQLQQAMSQFVQEHPEMEVPAMIKALRQMLHLTHADMARIGGVSVPALRNLEVGRASPTLDTVGALLRPLGLKLAVVTQRKPQY